jgi:hypothetical protein
MKHAVIKEGSPHSTGDCLWMEYACISECICFPASRWNKLKPLEVVLGRKRGGNFFGQGFLLNNDGLVPKKFILEPSKGACIYLDSYVNQHDS